MPKVNNANLRIVPAMRDEMTGELREAPAGVPLYLVKKHHAGRWISTLMSASTVLGMDSDLTLLDHRIIRIFEGIAEYESEEEGRFDAQVHMRQSDLARMLGKDRSGVCRSIKRLLAKKIIILRGEDLYSLNANFAWRGKHKNWRKRQGLNPKLECG